MIVLGNLDTYNFCIPKLTNPNSPYEVVHSPRLYDEVDLERAIYELARGRILDSNTFIEESGLFGRESGREAFKLLMHIGIANFFEDNNKDFYCLSNEGVEILKTDIRKFLEDAVLRYSPYIFVYDYIKRQRSLDKRTQNEIIRFFNRKHPNFGSGDSGKKNIQSIIRILENYSYITCEKLGRENYYCINKEKKNPILDLEYVIYFSIDDVYPFYLWIMKNKQFKSAYSNLFNLLNNPTDLINIFCKVIHKLKFEFIYNNFEKTQLKINDILAREFIELFNIYLNQHPDTYNIDYIKKVGNNVFEIECYFDIVFKCNQIEGFTSVINEKTLVKSLGLNNNYFRKSIPINNVILTSDLSLGIDIVSSLTSFNKEKHGITAPMNFEWKNYENEQLNDIFSTNENKVVFILDPISEVEQIRNFFKEKSDVISDFFNKGGNIIFSAPIQFDFEDGRISQGNRGIDSFRDILKYLFGVEYLPKIYNPGPSSKPVEGNRCILTSLGKKLLTSLDGEKKYEKNIDYNGVLMLPTETRIVYNKIGSFIDLINPILGESFELSEEIDKYKNDIISKDDILKKIKNALYRPLQSDVSILAAIRIKNGMAFLTNINPKKCNDNLHTDLYETIIRLAWYSVLISGNSVEEEFSQF